MKRTLITLALAAAAPLALSACMEDGYTTTSVGIGWQSYPYDVWYDDYYGPFYDGYWGTDGFFYYRLLQNQNVWRRADQNHFRRQPPANTDRYRQYNGSTHQPPPNAKLPNYPGWGTGPNQGQSHDQNRNRDRNRR